MKWLWVTAVLTVHSTNLLAQKVALNKVEGLVHFDKDSTYWVAVVSQKGLVRDVFKMVFNFIPNSPLPPDGRYRITYKPSLFLFTTVNGNRRYIFSTSKRDLAARRGHTQWKVKSLARIDPVSYPWVEL